MTRVIAVAGSLRPGSVTRQALAIAVEGARAAGAGIDKWDLGRPRLPLFEESARELPEVVQLKQRIKGCDALLVGTPVYHDSYSGPLKNALDFLYDELTDKVVALIAVGGGSTGQGQALEHLRAVFRETGSWTLPRQVGIGQSTERLAPAGAPPRRRWKRGC